MAGELVGGRTSSGMESDVRLSGGSCRFFLPGFSEVIFLGSGVGRFQRLIEFVFTLSLQWR